MEDKIFKDLAKLYVDKESDLLFEELKIIEKDNSIIFSKNLDFKIRKYINKTKYKTYTKYFSFVACLILLFVIAKNVFFTKDSTTSNNEISQIHGNLKTNKDYIYMSQILKDNYTINNIDYDKSETIYYLEDNWKDFIVLTTEELINGENKINLTGFEVIQFNDKEIYLIDKNDFKLIKFIKNNTIYTLTSEFDIDVLLEISKLI